MSFCVVQNVCQTNNPFQIYNVTLISNAQDNGTYFLLDRLFLNLLFVLFFRFVPKDSQLLRFFAQISDDTTHSTMGHRRIIELFLFVLYENLVQLVNDIDDFVESALNQQWTEWSRFVLICKDASLWSWYVKCRSRNSLANGVDEGLDLETAQKE